MSGLPMVLALLLAFVGLVLSEKDTCFCKLEGDLDDCSCTVQSIDSFNNIKLYPQLSKLLETDYFRYYKVNLFRRCPFESGSGGQCGSKSCAVDECSEDKVPRGLKNNKSKNKYLEEAQKPDNIKGCHEDENELGFLDYTIRWSTIKASQFDGDASKEAFEDWKKHDDAQENFCEPEDEESPDAAYYDLVLNPERFTGYAGPSAVNVWKLIYDQNCFKPDKTDYNYLNPQQGSDLKDLCLEKRTFYRMISGFHTSINVDVTANWLIPGLCLESRTLYHLLSGLHSTIGVQVSAVHLQPATGWGQPSWGPNLEEFRKRFDPDKTYGEGPNRLKNMYFTYLVEMRALAKAAPYLEQEKYYTGNEKLDSEVQQTVRDILQVIRSFPEHFDESQLFKGDQQKLKEDFKVHFRNISRIMDCVGCDKCRLWGKLQITGMGTALKILFSGQSMGPDSTVSQADKKANIPFQLSRGEIVALFNGFGRLSKSIHEVDSFRRMMT